MEQDICTHCKQVIESHEFIKVNDKKICFNCGDKLFNTRRNNIIVISNKEIIKI